MKNIKITIKEIEGHKGEFLAYCKNEFLSTTFCVYFTDTIYGSVGLNHFAEMLKYKYGNNNVSFDISCKKLTFKNPKLLEVMIRPPAS